MLRPILTVALLVTAPLLAGQTFAASWETVPIVEIGQRNMDTGGTARLDRSTELFRLNVRAAGLTPGNAYLLMLVAYNNPGACRRDTFTHCEWTVDSNGQGGDPRVASTTLYLAGGVAEADGTAIFNGNLERGARGLAGREVLEGTGVYNMLGAKLQVIIRSMGAHMGSGVSGYGQTTERGFGCNVNTCTNVQIATFD